MHTSVILTFGRHVQGQGHAGLRIRVWIPSTDVKSFLWQLHGVKVPREQREWIVEEGVTSLELPAASRTADVSCRVALCRRKHLTLTHRYLAI